MLRIETMPTPAGAAVDESSATSTKRLAYYGAVYAELHDVVVTDFRGGLDGAGTTTAMAESRAGQWPTDAAVPMTIMATQMSQFVNQHVSNR